MILEEGAFAKSALAYKVSQKNKILQKQTQLPDSVFEGTIERLDNALVVTDKQTPVLVKGTIRVTSKDTIKIRTVFATIESKGGEFWINYDGEKVTVRNITCDQLSVNQKDSTDYNVPATFEIWIGDFVLNGKQSVGVFSPVEIHTYIEDLSKISKVDKVQFKKQVLALKDKWLVGRKKGYDLVNTIQIRHIASISENDKKNKNQYLNEESVKANRKKQYFNKVFGLD